jgi:substrate import-associated zinc metallohydrolase lipoprotein
VLIGLFAAISSCKKDKFEKTDISELNPDETATNTALDQWLKTTFLDEYNIDVIYHYHRYYHESDRNVSPPKVETVQPMMTTVLDGYIKPYREVAGVTFIKTNAPREFVLYGSTSYDAQNIGYAGTASGGVRVNLFGLNNFSLSPGFVTSRLNVIHHEFTHILNQRYLMPPEFKLITNSSYKATWTSTPLDTAHKYGYVSSYASQNPTEDFAEMTCTMLVKGQPWFDNWVKTTTSATGQAALRAKESSVVNYFGSSLNVDFRALQSKMY